MTLRELGVGESARVTKVGGEGALRQHFLDMGVIPGVEVTVVKLAPMGDPMELRLHDYELTLRLAEAEQIGIEEIGAASAEENLTKGNPAKEGQAKEGQAKKDKQKESEWQKTLPAHSEKKQMGQVGVFQHRKI